MERVCCALQYPNGSSVEPGSSPLVPQHCSTAMGGSLREVLPDAPYDVLRTFELHPEQPPCSSASLRSRIFENASIPRQRLQKERPSPLSYLLSPPPPDAESPLLQSERHCTLDSPELASFV